MKSFKVKTIGKINDTCKYVVWIVDYGTGSTSNPMTKPKAIRLLNKCRRENPVYYKNAGLIKTWSCVSSKNL